MNEASIKNCAGMLPHTNEIDFSICSNIISITFLASVLFLHSRTPYAILIKSEKDIATVGSSETKANKRVADKSMMGASGFSCEPATARLDELDKKLYDNDILAKIYIHGPWV